MLTLMPSVVTVHLPNGSDLVFRNRARKITGRSGKKDGTNQFQVGTCQIMLDDYDNLVNPTGGGGIDPEVLERSFVSVGIGGTTMFSGRVRTVKVNRRKQYTAINITLHDAMAELAQLNDIELDYDLNGRIPKERTGLRINRILDKIGWGTFGTWKNIELGTVNCSEINSARPEGLSGQPLRLLQQVADTEWGRLGIAFGHPMESRSYNRGTLTFVSRQPAPEPWLTIDTTGSSSGVSSVRPDGALEVIPDKTQLYNRVKYTIHSGAERLFPPASDTSASIQEYGESVFTAPNRLLSGPAEAQAWASWFLTVYSQPRVAIKQVKLAPYFQPADTARLIHQINIGRSVRIINRQAHSTRTSVTLHRVDQVNFTIRPGDLTVRDANGAWAGGAICDITLGVQIPEASSFWNYGVRGASELGQTTILAQSQPDDPYQNVPGNLFLRQDIPPPPYSWPRPKVVSWTAWNALIVNKAIQFYSDGQDRFDNRARPVISEGLLYPAAGEISVTQDSGIISVWNGTTLSEVPLAQPEGRQRGGDFLLDDPIRGRLDAGNRID